MIKIPMPPVEVDTTKVNIFAVFVVAGVIKSLILIDFILSGYLSFSFKASIAIKA